jgi:cell volume regulation protein A
MPCERKGNEFGVELPEEINTNLSDMVITENDIENGDTLKDMSLPRGTLVMIVKREDEYIIPNGSLKLHIGDRLLLMSEKNE